MSSYSSYDGHGVDVAVNRADSLDKLALAYVVEHPGCRVLELGSGAGGQSVRIAKAGATVVAVDQFDFSPQFAEYGLNHEQLRFVCSDITNPALYAGTQFDIAICQRTLHYLPYNDAQKLLQALSLIIYDKLFISVTGSGSLVGDTYPCASEEIFKRFCELSELGQEMFSIKEPVCLYTENEFKQLLQDSGWQIDSSRVTAFGNIQIICKTTT